MNAINEKPEAAEFSFIEIEDMAMEIEAIAETINALSKGTDDVPRRSAQWIGDRLRQIGENLDAQVQAYCQEHGRKAEATT